MTSGAALAASVASPTNQIKEETTANHEAPEHWLTIFNDYLRSKNYESTFMVMFPQKSELYRWRHGVIDGVELEQLSMLNGPGWETVRRDDTVSYFEPSSQPYSIKAKLIDGPIPKIFFQDLTELAQAYEFVLAGRDRIVGRLAQQIKIVARDRMRYGYDLWLDTDSHLLLKMTMKEPGGKVIEEIQMTTLDVTEKPHPSLVTLSKAKLPQIIDIDIRERDLSWEVQWLPKGFKLVGQDRHRLALTRQLVEHKLYSDGLVSVGVYIKQAMPGSTGGIFGIEDGTTIVSQIVDNYEIAVVGKVPAITAEQIARSVVLTKASTPMQR